MSADDRAGVEPGRMPEALCRACVELLPVDGASVCIAGGPSVRATWCASDRTAARLAETQYTLGDGPCQCALDGAAAVLAADLTQGPDARRWPVFAAEAVGLGVRAVFSLPLGADGTTIGTLDLYRARPGGLSESDLRIALWTRDAVTFAITTALQSGHGTGEGPAEEGVAPWVRASEAGHGEVHQAVGMVMVQLDLSPEQALDRIRAAAFAEGRTVSELARDIVLRRVGLGPEPGDDRETRKSAP
ncbi:GAF and ANTAR domain-containing protein [Streptomyces sp. NPDC005435]|uniref:GAF and ANTAR domain-containing protein n=1 Tax=Streptomyces sp. NPDC005435 TaxID=3154464 RepID=UPI0034512AB7